MHVQITAPAGSRKMAATYTIASKIIAAWIAVVNLWRTTSFKTVTEETKELIKKALLERNSLRGICRIFDVSLTWLLAFVAELYAVLPADLGIDLQSAGGSDAVSLFTLAVEADEMWSFVAKKSNKQWIGIALDAKTRQIIAFHVGDRSRECPTTLEENTGRLPATRYLLYRSL